MAFVVTQNVSRIQGTAVRSASRRLVDRLRHLGAQLQMGPQQRAERYVAHLPTAVLGAC